MFSGLNEVYVVATTVGSSSRGRRFPTLTLLVYQPVRASILTVSNNQDCRNIPGSYTWLRYKYTYVATPSPH